MTDRVVQRFLFSIASVATILICQTSANAARLLHVEYEVDGEQILATAYTDGGADAATVWRYLSETPNFGTRQEVTDEKVDGQPDGRKEVVRKFAPFSVDENDPMRATLTGDVVVRILHASQTIAEVKVSELTLIRDDSSEDRWYVPEAEVEHTAMLAGLGTPTPATAAATWIGMGIRVFFVAAIVLLVVVGILAVVISTTRKRSVAQ